MRVLAATGEPPRVPLPWMAGVQALGENANESAINAARCGEKLEVGGALTAVVVYHSRLRGKKRPRAGTPAREADFRGVCSHV
jgi:hypothetical protein